MHANIFSKLHQLMVNYSLIHCHRNIVNMLLQLIDAALNGKAADVTRLIQSGANIEAKDVNVRASRYTFSFLFGRADFQEFVFASVA
jgi:hypothetical protein